MKAFSFASTPHIYFGAGKRGLLTEIASQFGRRVLLVTGASSFDQSARCQQLLKGLQTTLNLQRVKVAGEPSPRLIDEAVMAYRAFSPDVVVAIGGGSAVDAGKAIAGLLPSGDSVMDYLEGVGAGKVYSGISTPFIAMPTTAGTGGETSKNAVVSRIGQDGFKKSFRHESLVAKHVILDPELTLDCPPDVTAACGLDAFTQLLESWVSSNANPITDALAFSGMTYVRDSLIKAVEHGDDLAARSGMLYASSISGLTLANAGLGSVHGLASPLGAFYPIPHGVVCGTLLPDAVRINVEAMHQRSPEHRALEKYANAGRLMLACNDLDDEETTQAFILLLKTWKKRLNIESLSSFGVQSAHFDHIVANSRGSSMQTNPIELKDDELTALLHACL
ncbi:MAG: iron-containing alcohol dehydrogenase [Mariprofundaceae bacterium]